MKGPGELAGGEDLVGKSEEGERIASRFLFLIFFLFFLFIYFISLPAVQAVFLSFDNNNNFVCPPRLLFVYHTIIIII